MPAEPGEPQPATRHHDRRADEVRLNSHAAGHGLDILVCHVPCSQAESRTAARTPAAGAGRSWAPRRTESSCGHAGPHRAR
eukprot:8776618-Pyramimonas_sp.AAC.1